MRFTLSFNLYFTLKQLEVFEAIVQYGSFSMASKELHMCQSSVSTHMKELEEWHGSMLLIRHSNRAKVELTEQGQQFLYRVQKILKSCRNMEEDMKNRLF